MRLKRTLLGTVSAVGILGAIGAANAQTADPKNVPGDQALQSIDRNLQKDADKDNAGLKSTQTRTTGLENAQKRIEDNQADRAARKTAKTDRDKVARAEKAERVDKADRPEKPERPDRPERAGRS